MINFPSLTDSFSDDTANSKDFLNAYISKQNPQEEYQIAAGKPMPLNKVFPAWGNPGNWDIPGPVKMYPDTYQLMNWKPGKEDKTNLLKKITVDPRFDNDIQPSRAGAFFNRGRFGPQIPGSGVI